MTMITSIALISGYTVAYAILHSWLAHPRVKERARRSFGTHADRWYRLVYNALSVVLLFPFVPMLLWLPDRPLYTLAFPWLWLALVGQGLALAGIAYGIWLTGAWHFLGLRQLAQPRSDDGTQSPPQLVVAGPYRWVRHPLYFFGLVLIWLTPQMTVNRLMLAVLLSIYLYVGTFFEERRLVGEFGEAYRAYQRRVPRLIPGLRV